jgi:hypothetical protein
MGIRHVVISLVATIGVGVLAVVPARAHHAFSAEFDANRPVKVKGTIARVEWTNPHTWFHIDVKRPDGQVERWMFEGGGPGSLTRRGFSKDYLALGTEIVVEGFLSKGVPRRANARNMTYPDGRTLFVGSSGTGAPADGADASERPKRP